MDYTYRSSSLVPNPLKMDTSPAQSEGARSGPDESQPLLQRDGSVESCQPHRAPFPFWPLLLILTMLSLFLLLYHLSSALAVDTVVRLDYASYQGTSADGVTRWLGMRYAAPPTDALRFAAPQ